jgi:hypothetical protein
LNDPKKLPPEYISYINPLNYTVSSNKDFLGGYTVDDNLTDVKSIDNERIELVFKKIEGDIVTTQSFTFWTKPSLPVITKLYKNLHSPRYEEEVSSILTDFIQCSGGLVAKKIIYIVQPSNGSIRVSEWLSTDLGKDQPSEEDFTIHLDPKTLIIGLANKPKPGEIVSLNPENIKASDLLIPDSAKKQFKPDIKNRRLGNRYFYITLITFIFFIFLYFLFKIRTYYFSRK